MVGDAWAAGWLLPLLVLFVGLLLGVAAVAVARPGLPSLGGSGPAPRPMGPEALLRERYARGELTRAQYREALVDVLKDRYVRGELELEAYEAQLARLLEEPPARRGREAA